MANLVFQPAFLADDWEKERFVILEELRQTESLVDRLSRQKKAALRPLSRFVGRAPIGTRAGIEGVTISDIQAFHDRFYRASNMTLIISGRIDQDATHAWAEAYFDHIGWIGFDVSNGHSPDQRYIRVATGLDYRDAAPVRGMRYGAAQENLVVQLQVQQ